MPVCTLIWLVAAAGTAAARDEAIGIYPLTNTTL